MLLHIPAWLAEAGASSGCDSAGLLEKGIIPQVAAQHVPQSCPVLAAGRGGHTRSAEQRCPNKGVVGCGVMDFMLLLHL